MPWRFSDADRQRVGRDQHLGVRETCTQPAVSMRNKLREQRAWNSLNQFISLCDEERRHFETKRLGGLQIDQQLELRRLLYG